MTAVEWARLLAEAVPDGTFGGPRPAEPGVDPRAAEHRAVLEAATRPVRPEQTAPRPTPQPGHEKPPTAHTDPTEGEQ